MEDGRVPAKEARNWRIEVQKEKNHEKEYQRLLNKFEMAQKGLWNLAKENILRARGMLPKKATPLESTRKFLEQLVKGRLKRERKKERWEVGKENKEERGEKRRREGEKEENEAGTVKRSCDGFVSVEGF